MFKTRRYISSYKYGNLFISLQKCAPLLGYFINPAIKLLLCQSYTLEGSAVLQRLQQLMMWVYLFSHVSLQRMQSTILLWQSLPSVCPSG